MRTGVQRSLDPFYRQVVESESTHSVSDCNIFPLNISCVGFDPDSINHSGSERSVDGSGGGGGRKRKEEAKHKHKHKHHKMPRREKSDRKEVVLFVFSPSPPLTPPSLLL